MKASKLPTSIVNALKTPLFRRIALIIVVFVATVASIVGLLHLTPGSRLLAIAKQKLHRHDGPEPLIDVCTPQERLNATTPKIWNEANAKYSELMDDKFTIAIQTYRRPKELKETIHKLTDKKIPSLLEIVVVWNDLEDSPPRDYSTTYGVPVRYRKSKVNSLNQKLLADPEYQTQAILLSDDDVYYEPDDLEFVFQSWRKFGRHRMTGALPRCATVGEDGTWNYTFCSNKGGGKPAYSMILTNLSFAHISLLEYYWSDDPHMKKVRDYVDEHFNCEDIAMNHLTGLLTGEGPLLVRGRTAYKNQEPTKGISTKPGHLQARSQCINDFAEIFGCMALVDEEGYMGYGA